MLPLLEEINGRDILKSPLNKDEAKQLRDDLYELTEAFQKEHKHNFNKVERIQLKKIWSRSKPYQTFGFEIKMIHKGAPQAAKRGVPLDIKNQTAQSKAFIQLVLKFVEANEILPDALYKIKQSATYYWSNVTAQNTEESSPLLTVPKIVMARDPMDHACEKGVTHTFRIQFFYH